MISPKCLENGLARSNTLKTPNVIRWGALGAMACILCTSLGLVLMGISTLRAGVLARGFGLVGPVVFLPIRAYGGFVVGHIWLALGYAR